MTNSETLPEIGSEKTVEGEDTLGKKIYKARKSNFWERLTTEYLSCRAKRNEREASEYRPIRVPISYRAGASSKFWRADRAKTPWLSHRWTHVPGFRNESAKSHLQSTIILVPHRRKNPKISFHSSTSGFFRYMRGRRGPPGGLCRPPTGPRPRGFGMPPGIRPSVWKPIFCWGHSQKVKIFRAPSQALKGTTTTTSIGEHGDSEVSQAIFRFEKTIIFSIDSGEI